MAAVGTMVVAAGVAAAAAVVGSRVMPYYGGLYHVGPTVRTKTYIFRYLCY